MKPIDVSITDYQQMVVLFHGETDRGAAVLAGSYVENFLAAYLKFQMVDQSLSERLFSDGGSLSSFSQRIDFAQAFGFLPSSVCAQLHLIRKIRNHFAHHPKSASFTESPVRNYANELSFAAEKLLPDGQSLKVDGLKNAYLLSAGMFVVMAHNQMHVASSAVMSEIKPRKPS